MKLSLSDQQERIFMKLIVDEATDRVLGQLVVLSRGANAGDCRSVEGRPQPSSVDDTIGIHPTAA